MRLTHVKTIFINLLFLGLGRRFNISCGASGGVNAEEAQPADAAKPAKYAEPRKRGVPADEAKTDGGSKARRTQTKRYL